MSRWLFIAALIASLATAANSDSDALTALIARTDAVAKEVSRVRRLPLKKKIDKEVVDRDELRARLVKLAGEAKTQAEARAEGLALARWGMLPLDADYLKLLVELLTDQIAGYYDPATKKLTINKRSGQDPVWAEMVLAHEIGHALQDQAYDLAKFEDLPPGEGDAALARHALIEGDGIALMIEMMLARGKQSAPWANPEFAAELAKAMAAPTDDALDKAPLAIREAMLFPYREGFAFVAALRRRQPWSAVDAAFKRPPRSTEHILHPEKYRADELPVAVTVQAPAALADQALIHTTVWGELGYELFLRAHGLDTRAAKQAAAGWGGDRVVVIARSEEVRPERTVGLGRFEWDSEADAIEAHEAAVRALDSALIGATAEHGETRTRWLALDGTATFAERRGTSTVLAIGVPARLVDTVGTEAWTATAIAAKSKQARQASK